ncbi:MAG: hypothetical protein ACFFG0_38630 [Candidatus Thorarchaeota archaeon]
MTKSLERQFDRAMLSIYERAKNEAGYNATRFLQMLYDYGGLETAKILLYEKRLSEGFTALWELDRLDLTMEAMILKSPWKQLFTEEELKIAEQRLTGLDFFKKKEKT